MNLENPIKQINLEEKIDNTIKKVLSGYPEISFFNQDFTAGLDEIKRKIQETQTVISADEFYEKSEKSFEYQEQIRVEYNRRENSLSIPKFDFATNDIKISKGEILSGLEWGKKFYLDPKTFNEKINGKEFYQQYLLALVEKATLSLLDKFILEREIAKNEKEDKMKAEAYVEIKNKEEKSLDNMQMGVVAEKIIKSFLVRLSVDKPGFEFEIVHTNVYQDVDLKIDFIVKSKHVNRGVKVGLLEEAEDIQENKIQLTINNNPEKLELKHKQLEEQLKKLNEVVLIELPKQEIEQAFHRWKEKGNKISTPDKYLSPEIQKIILEKMLDKITPELDKKIKNAII